MKKEQIQIVVSAKNVASRALGELNGTLGRIQKTVFNLKTAFTGLVVAVGGTATLSSFVKTAAGFEQIKVSLETVLGSAAKAQKAFAWITDFTAKTPYQLEDVADAFRKLSAYGFDATQSLQTLGDAASAMGKSLDQAVEAFADAATGEFERLKEFGIKTQTVGDEVTFSWVQNGKTMTKTVQKNSVEITDALLGIFSRFQGGMEKQSQTFEGLMSNLKDQWTLFKNKVMDSGLFEYLKAGLAKILEKIQDLKNKGKLDEWAKKTSDYIVAGFKAASVAVEWFAKIVLGLEGTFYAVRAIFDKTMGVIFKAFSKYYGAWAKVAGFLGFDNYSKLWGDIAKELENLSKAASDIGEENLNTVVNIGSSIDDITNKVNKFWDDLKKQTEKVKQNTKDIANDTKKVGENSASGLVKDEKYWADMQKKALEIIKSKDYQDRLKAFKEIHDPTLPKETKSLSEIFDDFKEGIARAIANGIAGKGSVLHDIGQVFRENYSSIAQSLKEGKGLIEIIVAVLSRIFESLGVFDIFEGILKGIDKALKPIRDIIKIIADAFEEVIGAISYILKPIANLFRPVFLFIGKIAQYMGDIFESLGYMISVILRPILEIIKPIFKIMNETVGPVLKFIAHIIEGISNFIKGIPDAIASIPTKIADAVWDALKNLPKAIADAIKDMFSSLGGSIGDAAKKIPIVGDVIGGIGDVIGGIGGAIGSIGKAFGFAAGGVMTDKGPLPLRKYAYGGIADRPQIALFGEGRLPEAYVPLPDGRRIPVHVQGNNVGTVQLLFEILKNTKDLSMEIRRLNPDGDALQVRVVT